MPSFQSVGSLLPQEKEEEDKIKEEEEVLEVVKTKSDQRINQEEIMRMFNEELAQE